MGVVENAYLANKVDPVVEAVRADLHRRSQLGIKKYGTTLHENVGDHRYWLNHAYEEALDLANYLKKCIMDIDARTANYDTAFGEAAKEQHPAGCECADCWQKMEAGGL